MIIHAFLKARSQQVFVYVCVVEYKDYSQECGDVGVLAEVSSQEEQSHTWCVVDALDGKLFCEAPNTRSQLFLPPKRDFQV